MNGIHPKVASARYRPGSHVYLSGFSNMHTNRGSDVCIIAVEASFTRRHMSSGRREEGVIGPKWWFT